MKRIYFALVGIFCLFMTSCSDSPDSLSSRRICSLFEEKLEEQEQKIGYAFLTIGTYEENDLSERQKLMMLKEAGIITYSVKRYAWYNKSFSSRSVFDHNERYYWVWSGEYAYSKPVYRNQKVTNYDFEEHFIVDVKLTDKGKELKVDSIPTPKEVEDEDMKKIKIDLSTLPETKANLTENWPEIPYPDGSVKKQTKVVEPKSTSENTKKQTPNFDNAVDKKTAKDYYDAVEKCKSEDAILKAFKVDVDKARDIRIINNDNGVLATADIILRYKDVTEAGRILRGVYEGQYYTAPLTLVYYEDKGWKIKLIGDFTIIPVEFENKKVNTKDEKGKDNDIDYEVVDTAAVDTII